MDQLNQRQDTIADAMNTPPKASGLEMFATWAGLMLGAATILLLGILLGEKPFGLQIVAVAADTEYVFFLVFCDSRAWRGYSLRDKRVQRELPRLLGPHCFFLFLIVVALTVALSSRSRLPSSWVVESGSKHDSPFAVALIIAGVLAATAQAWLYRNKLARALAVENTAAQ